MKILWVSNAPWGPSGYGSQTRQVGLRIAQAGYEIEFSTNDGSKGQTTGRELAEKMRNPAWSDLLVRGSGQDRFSRDKIREDFERSGADWILSLYDAWVYTEQTSDPLADLPHVTGWVPVDHYPTPLALYGWMGSHSSIAMSRFGFDCLTDTTKAMAAGGGQTFPVSLAPHAVDDVFRPADGMRFRDLIDVPRDAYLVGIVAANYGTRIYDRKGWSDMSAAASRFMAAHPDAYRYVHTVNKTHDGIDLPLRFQFTGVPADRLRWADQYALKDLLVSDEQMAEIYSSFDVLLNTSRGEGFGLPGIEAQACGTPVILSNWTAQTELVAAHPWNGNLGNESHPSGWLVSVDPDWDPRQGADFAKPRIGSIIGALEEAYARRGDQALRDAAIAKAETYRADVVFDTYWRPILAEMEAALVPPSVIPLNREQRRAARRAKVPA